MAHRTLIRWQTIVCAIVSVVLSNEFATEITDEAFDAFTSKLEFIDELYPMTRNIGKSAVLSCRATGEPPLNIYIYHDRIATHREKKQKKRMLTQDTIYDSNKPRELAVVHNIENVQEKHEGIYKCQAESSDGQIAVSTMKLTVLDPCEGVTCGFRERCVNVRGSGICTCDYECDDYNSAVCGDSITYSSVCHMQRAECRVGEPVESMEDGSCPDSEHLESITEATCSLSGEGHVTKFNGDFFTFRGSCPYKMLEDSRGGVLIVYARTEKCGDTDSGNCLRSITIYVDRVYGFSIERGWVINDNGRSRNVLKGETLILGGGAVSLTRVGKTMVGNIENKKIQFFYDGLNYFKISVPLDYVSKHTDFEGFCGHVPVDHVPTTGRDISFLGDIKMPALGSEAVCGVEIGGPECTDSEVPKQVRDAFETNAALAACATVVPMEIYIERAIQDTCTCDLARDKNYCFCNIIYSYVEDCRHADVNIDFGAIDSCEQSFHQDVFRSEGISYNRRRWLKRRTN